MIFKCVAPEILHNYFVGLIIWINFAAELRGGAVVARWAHNPKVGGSNPSSATSAKKGLFF